MAKRKRLPSPSPERRAHEESAVRVHPPAGPARQCYMFTLPEDILCDILLWIRPDDEDQSIWLWLCRVSATCKVFHRLVRLEKEGVAHLMPKVFKLEQNHYYLSEGPHRPDLLPRHPVSLRVKLMDTIRTSGWMGSHIRSFRAIETTAMYDENSNMSTTIAVALKNLLTVPCFPNLLDVEIRLSYERFPLIDDRFLRWLARVHPGLRSLILMNSGYNRRQREIRPDAFGALSASMRGLCDAGIGVCDMERDDDERGGVLVVLSQHLAAFLCNLNPRLTSLELRFDNVDEPGDEGFSNLSVCCPDLKSLTILSQTITALRVAEIIRSKRNLVSIGLKCFDSSWNDEGVIDAIL